MLNNRNQLIEVLSRWPVVGDPRSVTPIRDGLSNALLWKIAGDSSVYCLRRWPPVISVGQLVEIHRLRARVRIEGLESVPRLVHNREGATIVAFGGHLWELADWVRGETVESLNPVQAAAAISTLAKFHRSAALHRPPEAALAPGLHRRLEMARDLQRGLIDAIEERLAAAPRTELREQGATIAREVRRVLSTVLAVVERASKIPLPLQWCLIDIHQGNLLFRGDRVTGLVDFGAAATDSVAVDLARLVASFNPADSHEWHDYVSLYEGERPLSGAELDAIAAYDAGGAVGAAADV